MYKILIAPVLIGLAAIMLSGCSATKHDLLKTGAVDIDPVPVDAVTYLYSNVWQDGAIAHISGRVALGSPEIVREEPAHIDVMVKDHNGEILMISHSPYMKHHHEGKGNQVNYHTAARLLLRDNSTVILQHHFAAVSIHDS
jgi:hypothetical protein